VGAVSTRAEALHEIGAREFDFILFDMTLPELPVDEFYRAVEAVKPQMCQRIIFMTSDEAHPAADGFVRRQKGVSLWKPFELGAVLEVAESIRSRIQMA
jgi:DNA-binding NarL/FixJ family response regulator